jgi:RNA recognition motif-containing protein
MISISNLSFCIYIGNTTSIDDKTLFNYCSRFGTIRSILFEKEKFCDFHLIEFSNDEQSQRFLNQNNHEIDRILLDIKSYKHLLIHHDILNIDRKFYIGPILNSKDEHTIVQFYKAIDPTLQYCLSEQNNQVYLLIEFNNRQSVTRIFEKQTMPITNEYRKFSLYKPIHPKEFVNKLISMKNKQNQIHIHGLTDQITETMLM